MTKRGVPINAKARQQKQWETEERWVVTLFSQWYAGWADVTAVRCLEEGTAVQTCCCCCTDAAYGSAQVHVAAHLIQC
jgi:hypothetical protein